MSWLLWIILQWMWGCRYLFKVVIFSPLNIYSEVGLPNHMVILVLLSFWGTCILFPIVAVPIYISTNSAQGFSFFLHPHQHVLSLLFMIIIVLKGARWYLIVVLIWFFLMISDIEHLFMYLLAICMSSLEKCLFRFLVCFFIAFFFFSFFFCYWITWVPCILWILTPYQIYGFQVFSPIPCVTISFCWLFLLLCRSFLVWCSPSWFCFHNLGIWCCI